MDCRYTVISAFIFTVCNVNRYHFSCTEKCTLHSGYAYNVYFVSASLIVKFLYASSHFEIRCNSIQRKMKHRYLFFYTISVRWQRFYWESAPTTCPIGPDRVGWRTWLFLNRKPYPGMLSFLFFLMFSCIRRRDTTPYNRQFAMYFQV